MNSWTLTALTALLLLSVIPNMWLKRRAEQYDLKAVRIGMVLMSLVGAALVPLRLYEFAHLNVRWDTNAYGSIVWMLLGLHTTHLVTDTLDSAILAALLLWGPFESKRYVGKFGRDGARAERLDASSACGV